MIKTGFFSYLIPFFFNHILLYSIILNTIKIIGFKFLITESSPSSGEKWNWWN